MLEINASKNHSPSTLAMGIPSGLLQVAIQSLQILLRLLVKKRKSSLPL